jgi:hypothetical protein
VRRAHRDPPPGAGNLEVRDVERLTGELLGPLPAQHVASYDAFGAPRYTGLRFRDGGHEQESYPFVAAASEALVAAGRLSGLR